MRRVASVDTSCDHNSPSALAAALPRRRCRRRRRRCRLVLLLELQWPAALVRGDAWLAAEYGSAVAAGRVPASGWTIASFGCITPPAAGGLAAAARPAPVPAALVPSLNWIWPDITPGKPVVVADGAQQHRWQRAWHELGGCYGLGGSTAYFLDAVRTAARLNISEALASAGIVPSASRAYRGKRSHCLLCP